MCFSELSEIAEYIGKESDTTKFDELQKLLSGGKLFITFWGHFSAGKSKLVNNLIGRNLLPVKPKESTAVLTYIGYGEDETAHLHYADGSSEVYPISDIKNIFEGANFQADKIEYIDICLPLPFLQNGLVLVDTPGINTILTRHQTLAFSAMQSAGQIVYVLGGATSKNDTEFIEMIAKAGIRILFVRTKCDEFSAMEENATVTLQEQADQLAKLVGREIEFFAVSNERDSAEYFGEIDKLRQRLAILSKDADQELIEICNERCKVYAEEYANILRRQQAQCQEMLDGHNDSFEKEIALNQNILKKMRDKLGQNEANARQELLTTKNEAQNIAKQLVEKHTNRFAQKLNAITFGTNCERRCHEEYKAGVQNALQDMQLNIHALIDQIITEEHKTLTDDISIEDIPPLLSYAEMEEDSFAGVEQYRENLIKIKCELQKLAEEKASLTSEKVDLANNESVREYQEAIDEIDEKLSQIPKDIAMREIPANNTVSETFRRIGETADLAMLLLPTGTIAKGASMVLKAKPLAQFANKARKITEIISPFDTVRTAKKASMLSQLKRVFNKRGYAHAATEKTIQSAINQGANKLESNFRERNGSGILDAFSLAYWFQKIGSNFDEMPRLEVDTEVEAQKTAMRRQLIEEKNRILEEKIKQKKALNLIKSKQDELAERERRQNEIAVEVEKQMKRAEEKERTTRFSEFKARYKKYFADNINQLFGRLTENIFADAEQNFALCFAKRNQYMINAVKEKERLAENTANLAKQGEDRIREEIAKCAGYLKTLEGLPL